MRNEAVMTYLLWSLHPHLQPQACPFAGPCKEMQVAAALPAMSSDRRGLTEGPTIVRHLGDSRGLTPTRLALCMVKDEHRIKGLGPLSWAGPEGRAQSTCSGPEHSEAKMQKCLMVW